MKKIISIFISTLLLLCSLSFTVFATDYEPVTFSDDFTSLYFYDTEYISVSNYKINIGDIFNGSNDGYENKYYTDQSYPYVLDEKQENEIENIYIYSDFYEFTITAEIRYKNGFFNTVTYLNKAYEEEYNQLTLGKSFNTLISFEYPMRNIVNTDLSVLKAAPKTEIEQKNFKYNVLFYVYNESANRNFSTVTGCIFITQDKYYYADVDENHENVFYNYLYNYYDFYEADYLVVHEIVDEKLILDIDNAMEKYYNSDWGFVYDEELTNNVSSVFLTILFIIFPICILILSLVVTFKAKKKQYKKIFITVSLLSVIELILYFITSYILNNSIF